MTEDQLLSAVLDLAMRLRWHAYHVRNSRAGIVQGETGFPDLVLLRDGRLVFAELKSEGGGVTGPQAGWLARLSDALGPANVFVWRPADWLDGTIERELR